MKCLINCIDSESSWLAKIMPGIHPHFLRVLNKPILEYFIDFCVLNGITDIRIVKSDPSSEMEKYFEEGPQKGLNISYALSRETDSISKTLLKNSRFCSSEDLLIIDGFFFLSYHRNQVEDFLSDKTTPASMQGGAKNEIYFLPKGMKFKEIDFTEAGRILPGYTITILDSITDYYQLCKDILYNKQENYFLPGYSSATGEFVGKNVVFNAHRTKFDKPFMIGDNVQIIDNCHISKGAIIGDNVIIDSYSTIQDSIIYNQSYLGRNLEIINKIVYKNRLIDPLDGEFIDIVDEFFISKINKVIENSFLRSLNRLLALIGIIFGLIPFLFFWLLRPILGVKSIPQKYIKNLDDKEIILSRYLIEKPNTLNRIFIRMSIDKYPLLFKVISGKLDLVGNKLIPNDSFGKKIIGKLDMYHPGAFSYPELFATNIEDSNYEFHEIYYNHNANFKFIFKILFQHAFHRFFSVREYFDNGYFKL